MHFAAFENKGSVDLLEFKIPKRHVVRRQMKSSGERGEAAAGAAECESCDGALVHVGLDKHLDEITISHDVSAKSAVSVRDQGRKVLPSDGRGLRRDSLGDEIDVVLPGISKRRGGSAASEFLAEVSQVETGTCLQE